MRRITPHQHGLDVDVVGCRRLWCAVIEQQFLIATQAARDGKVAGEVTLARSWFASRACAEVCTLIGLDPAWIREGAARAFARSDAQGGRADRGLRRWDKGTIQAVWDLHHHVGLTFAEIGERFNVSRSTISGIIVRERFERAQEQGRAA